MNHAHMHTQSRQGQFTDNLPAYNLPADNNTGSSLPSLNLLLPNTTLPAPLPRQCSHLPPLQAGRLPITPITSITPIRPITRDPWGIEVQQETYRDDQSAKRRKLNTGICGGRSTALHLKQKPGITSVNPLSPTGSDVFLGPVDHQRSSEKINSKSELVATKRKLGASLVRNYALRAENDKLQESLNTLEERLKSLEGEKQDSKSRHSRLQSTLINRSDECLSLKKELGELNRQIQKNSFELHKVSEPYKKKIREILDQIKAVKTQCEEPTSSKIPFYQLLRADQSIPSETQCPVEIAEKAMNSVVSEIRNLSGKLDSEIKSKQNLIQKLAAIINYLENFLQ